MVHVPLLLSSHGFVAVLRNLKWIQVVGAGYNHITETPFWRSIPDSHPIILANATGVHVRSIAEHVIMYILALTHKLPQSHEMNRRDRRWPAFDTFDKSGAHTEALVMPVTCKRKDH